MVVGGNYVGSLGCILEYRRAQLSSLHIPEWNCLDDGRRGRK